MPTKDELRRELAEVKRQIAELQTRAGATSPDPTPPETLVSELFNMMWEAAGKQIRAKREATEAQRKAMERDQDFLPSQITRLMEELVNANNRKYKGQHDNSQEGVVNAVKEDNPKWREMSKGRNSQQQSQGTCGRCGRGKHQSYGDCPAYGKECNTCSKTGHFASQCWDKKQTSTFEKPKRNGRVIVVNRVGSTRPAVSVHVLDPGTKESLGWQEAIADTGAEVCVGGAELLRKLGISKERLKPGTSKLSSFNGARETCIGTLQVELRNRHYSTVADVNICPQVTDNLLLSLETCKALGYVRRDFPEVIKPGMSLCSTGMMSTRLEKWILPEATTETDHNKVDQKPNARRKEATTHYNSRAKDLPDLEKGQRVRILDNTTKLWDTTGVVVKAGARRQNYLVRVGEHQYFWRSRKSLRPNPSGQPEQPLGDSSTPQMQSTRGRRRSEGVRKRSTFQLPEDKSKTQTPSTRKSRRKRKQPDRLGILRT